MREELEWLHFATLNSNFKDPVIHSLSRWERGYQAISDTEKLTDICPAALSLKNYLAYWSLFSLPWSKSKLQKEAFILLSSCGRQPIWQKRHSGIIMRPLSKYFHTQKVERLGSRAEKEASVSNPVTYSL